MLHTSAAASGEAPYPVRYIWFAKQKGSSAAVMVELVRFRQVSS